MKRSPRGDPALAVAYLRVSTEEQHLGPEAQRAAIEHWATRDRVTMVAWHTDAGVSGAAELQVRPGLGAALDDMKRLRAGVLVVARRDRLARDVVIAATIERAVTQRGGRVVSADGVGNGDAPADQFMRTILDGAAAYERALIRARTRAALKAKRTRGERAGNVPWGYDADAVGKLSRDDEEHRTAERIHTLRTEGRSLRAIVRALADEGFVARTGKALGLTQVARIVRERSATRAA